ncbi:hypothetical protein ACFX2A_014636 [Malus domestica]
MKQHEKYARAEVLSLQSKAAKLHAKKIKVKIWTNYTPTPTYPKTIDNKNLVGNAWIVTVGWGSLMPPLKYQGDTNLCWAYPTVMCVEALYFIETREHISVDITSMIESAKDTMLQDGMNSPENGLEVMEKGALFQQGWPPQGKPICIFFIK